MVSEVFPKRQRQSSGAKIQKAGSSQANGPTTNAAAQQSRKSRPAMKKETK
jgi:hypothetical protein